MVIGEPMDSRFLLLLFIALLALPVILNSRRQKRAMADAQLLQNSLTVGDRVLTTSGLYGTVVGSADETTIDLEIAPGVRTTWLRVVIREKLIEEGRKEGEENTDEPAAASTSLATPIDGSARADNA